MNSFIRQIEHTELLPSGLTETFKTLIVKVEGLKTSHNHGSSGVDIADLDKETIEQYLEAFFEYCHIACSYLTRDKVKKVLSNISANRTETTIEEAALLDSVVSLGLLRKGDLESSRNYFNIASKSIWELISGAASVTKLQALVTMLLYTMYQPASNTTFLLLSNAINMILSLNLFTTQAIKSLNLPSNQEDCLKSLVWVLWSVEKVLCLRHGRLPLLREVDVDFGPINLPLGTPQGFCDSFLNISMVAWTTIFSAMIKGHRQASDIALLTITSGAFAQLSLSSEIDPGFYEISELGAFAVSVYRKLEAVGRNDEILVGPVDLSSQESIPSTNDSSEKSQELSNEEFSPSWFLEQDLGEMWDCDFDLDTSWNIDPGVVFEGLNHPSKEKNLPDDFEDMKMTC
ncbi:hypothetical protein HYFRA_00004700 [Hymenoscyphus fraxineus]|uniref:Xylanolytic transcriptional activator regulatory domain-containing protein n=1 Tax=Hymenoscyphus fraxineus TaxID=746836 RepID=A0A9N9KUZ9_9HELO|nr:hypothetical protein HYFRA_00004700 [Hymenoscyphus fraxineus]